MTEKKKTLCSLGIVVGLVGVCLLFLWRTGFFHQCSSLDGVRAYFDRWTPYGEIFYVIVQLISVLVAPIPSNVTAAGGALVFGLWPTFFLTWGSVVLGSLIVFRLSRALGKSFVTAFVSRKVSQRYVQLVESRRDVVLALAFLLPFFPDDILCILAGMTSISTRRFVCLVTIFRPWGLLVSCGVGSSMLTLSLPGMIALGVAGLALLFAGVRYGERIEQAVLRRIHRAK